MGRSGSEASFLRTNLLLILITFGVVTGGLLIVLWMLGLQDLRGFLLAPVLGTVAGLTAGWTFSRTPRGSASVATTDRSVVSWAPSEVRTAARGRGSDPSDPSGHGSTTDHQASSRTGQVTPQASAAQRMRVRAPWTWTLTDPLSTLETYQESDVWALVRKTHVEAGKLLAFTHGDPEEVAREISPTTATVYKVTRVEGESTVSPADVDRIADVISTHFAQGRGRAVVLPGLETIVESTNVRNVRRMIDLVRDLAMESKGSILVTLDPGSLSATDLSLLERGSRLLHARAPVPLPS